MKTNKILKVTGIMRSVLIGILLLFAICIEVMSRMNFYTYDYSLNFDYSSFWAIHGDYPVLFIFNTLFTTFASFSSLLENYVLYVIFEIMDIASLVLPVYLVYKSIRCKSTMANGLIIISSAVTFMIMVAYGVYTLLEIIRGAETFNIYSIIFIFIMLIKVTLCIVSQLRIRAINNAGE